MWAVCSGKGVIKMDEKNNQVDLEYYDLKGGTHHIYMAPGNVQWICNILFNTERMHDDFINDPPGWAKDLAGWKWNMQITRDRIHKIRMQVEEGLGYSTEEHWKKCLKKRGKKKNDDIGGDALELAFRRAAEKKNEVPKEPTQEELSKKDMQMSIFDMMK